MVVKEGRFGPYVTDGETNASLRPGDDPESLGERADLFAPGVARLGKAVQENEEVACPLAQVVQPDAIRASLPLLHAPMLARPMPACRP